MPFFFETSFWTSMDVVYQSGGRFAKPFDHWILRMLLAIASASMSYRHGDENYQRALSLVGDALRFAEDVLHPGSITGLQSILLLAQYSLVNPSHFRAWYLIGMAVRVMVDLGIHQDPPAEVVSDIDRLEIRRRVFYSIYNLDRSVCPSSTVKCTAPCQFLTFLEKVCQLCLGPYVLVLRCFRECRPTQVSLLRAIGVSFNPRLLTQHRTCVTHSQSPTDSVRCLPRYALQWARTVGAALTSNLGSLLESSRMV